MLFRPLRITLFFSIGIIGNCLSQEGACIGIGGPGNEQGRAVVVTSDGGLAIAGFTSSFGAGNNDVYVIRTDSAGNVLWTTTIGGTAQEVGMSIKECGDGTFLVAGHTTSYGQGSNDMYIIKLSSSGSLLWTKTLGGSAVEIAYSLLATADGGFVVAGAEASFGAGQDDLYIAKFDSTASLTWKKSIGGINSDIGWSIIQTFDRGYAVSGYTSSFGAGSSDCIVLKLDSLGNVAWSRVLGKSSIEAGYNIVQCPDSGYAVAGYTFSFGNGGQDAFIFKLNSSGNVLWSEAVGSTGDERLFSVVIDDDSDLVFAGYTTSFGAGGKDVYLVKTNQNGAIVWTRSAGGVQDEQGWCITKIPGKGFAITGDTYSFGQGAQELYLLITDSAGNGCCTAAAGGQAVAGGTSSSGGIVNTGGTLGSGGVQGSGGVSSYQCIPVYAAPVQEKDDLVLYPNPSTGIVQLSSFHPILSLQLFDLTGRCMISTGSAALIDLGAFGNGTYLLKLTTAKGPSFKKIILQKN